MKILLQGLLNDIKEEVESEKDIIKALRFLLKSKVIKHPFDIVGSSWVFILFEIINGLLDEENKISHKDIETPLLENSSTTAIDVKKPIYWKPYHLKLLGVSTCFVMFTFSPFYGFDWWSDVLVLIGNYKLSKAVETAFNA